LCIIALLAGWLCASGAMLDVVQVFAWARMFTGYARAMPVAEAAIETMDPNKPCPICLALRHAREESKQEQPATELAAAEKLVLVFDAAEPVVLVREQERWPKIRELQPLSWRSAVPVPPPRAGHLSSAV
jgi:hypothetical protein